MIARIADARERVVGNGYARRRGSISSALRRVVLPALHGLPGFVRATLLTRYDGDFWKIRVLTVWQNLDAVRAFAGADAEAARVELAAQAVLASYDTRAVHWNLVLEDRSKVTD